MTELQPTYLKEFDRHGFTNYDLQPFYPELKIMFINRHLRSDVFQDLCKRFNLTMIEKNIPKGKGRPQMLIFLCPRAFRFAIALKRSEKSDEFLNDLITTDVYYQSVKAKIKRSE